VTDLPVSRITLRARVGASLATERVRDMVVAAAPALAERHGVDVIDVVASADAVECRIRGSQIVALGFAAELRRTTESWYEHTHDGAMLWKVAE